MDGDHMTMVFLLGTVCVYSLLIGFVLKGVSKKSASWSQSIATDRAADFFYFLRSEEKSLDFV